MVMINSELALSDDDKINNDENSSRYRYLNLSYPYAVFFIVLG